MTPLNYELCKKLKDAGFPQKGGAQYVSPNQAPWDESAQSEFQTYSTPAESSWIKCPTLEELIDACGEGFERLIRNEMNDDSIIWGAYDFEGRFSGEGSTASEAVANLWLALHTK